MESVKKFKSLSEARIEQLVKTTMYLLIIMSAILLFMAILGCSKSSEDPDMQGTNKVGGVVMGTLKDQQGNAYPNSSIELKKGSEITSRKTDEDGVFMLNTKDVGAYNITVNPPLSTELVASSPTSVNVEKEKTTTVNFVIDPLPVKAHLNFGEVQLLEEIVDKDGNTPVNPNEPLYAANIFDAPLGLLTAIKAPDDHHVTLSEFKMAKGNLTVTCAGNTASINIALEGLIPNGTYTFWLAYLNKTRKVGEPIDFMNDFVNPTNPPVGASDGTENSVVANADGTINTTLEHQACVLTEEKALVIPVLYHINGKTFGGGHVPDPEEVVQLLVYFQ